MNKRRIFFSVGEPSGDLHASNLILDFKDQSPSQFEFFGFGGPKMNEAGCRLMEDMTEHAVMFLSGIFSKIAHFRSLLRKAEEVFRTEKVDLVVLIDYSGFNWHVAKRAKKYGIPVVFYGIPQMWAWAPWRVRKMRKYVDLGICKLPFEKKWLEERGCAAEYVGHPFFDEMQRQEFDDRFLQSIDQRIGDQDLVAILPGSRRQELRSNLPVFLKTARKLKALRPDTEFAISCLDEQQAELAREILAEDEGEPFDEVQFPIFGGKTAEIIGKAKCCLACSGSVSLELMYREKPTVIHYRLPKHLFAAQRLFLRVKYITLVNLLWVKSIARKGMQVFDPDSLDSEDIPFPEYLTDRDKSEAMSLQLLNLLDNDRLYNEKRDMLASLKSRYGTPGASRRAVDVIERRFFADEKSTERSSAA